MEVSFSVGMAGGVPKKSFFNVQNRFRYIHVVKEHEKRGRNLRFIFLNQRSLQKNEVFKSFGLFISMIWE